jgi:hypothetical protein
MRCVSIQGAPQAPDVLIAIRAIARQWNFECRERQSAAPVGDEGAIVFAADSDLPTLEASARSPTFIYLVGATGNDPLTSAPVDFSSEACLPVALRGQSLVTDSSDTAESAWAQSRVAGYRTVAGISGQPVWVARGMGTDAIHVVSCRPPRLVEGQRVSQILNAEKFLTALPIWLFFRELGGKSEWESAPRRACIVVDDPNLQFQRYGHIRYRKLLEFGRSNPFHLSIATVPLDGWWVNKNAAQIFREHPETLSMIVHGNDHLHGELALDFSASQRVGLVSQALRRIQVLERKAGLKVDRIMAPPHGVCSPDMLRTLWQNGYDGMTTNRWSLWKHFRPSSLPDSTGLRPADLLGDGIPVVSRFRFKSRLLRNEIHFAELFGQPIIPYGHQQDFAGQMRAFAETVDAVNHLGGVEWMSMRAIFESNFERRQEGETLVVKPYSRSIRGKMPEGARFLTVSPLCPTDKEGLIVSYELTGRSVSSAPRAGEAIAIPPGGLFAVSKADSGPIGARHEANFRSSPGAFLRRLAALARDQFSPLF